MRRTKIVCTIGPASNSVEVLKQLMISGMDVARLNFSHGTHSDHARSIENIRAAAEETGKQVGILLDTKGPEIRTGKLKTETITLQEGSPFVLWPGSEQEGDNQGVALSYAGLAKDVKPGDRVLIADGLVELRVDRVEQGNIFCTILSGGEIGPHKNVNVPGVQVKLPAVTEKDVADINFGIEQGVDFIAASFVRKAADVIEIRRLLEARGAEIEIIAKIENQEGVDNIDAILQVANGVMVARGDLGVQIPTEEVPLVQKMMISKCNCLGKPVITATQMLDSMIRNPLPTRAEASDVANAIFDGSDAIMLSGETASGKYPVEAVKTMARIAQRSEQALGYETIRRKQEACFQPTIPDAISHATSTIAADLGAAAIITATKSGSTAHMVSKYRPKAPIIAATPSASALRKLTLVWGVNPILVEETPGTDDMVAESVAKSLGAGLVQSGDLVVITAGVPVGVSGSTNLIKVHVVGNVLMRGKGIGNTPVSGQVKVARTAEEALAKVKNGDILVAVSTDSEFVPAIRKAAGMITEVGGLTSHGAIVGLSLGIPVIVGVNNATSLKDGEVVTLDTRRGLIYQGVAKIL